MTTKDAFCERKDSSLQLARPCGVCEDSTYCCTDCGLCLKCAERSHEEGDTCLGCAPRVIAELKEELKYADELMNSARSALFVVPALEKCLSLLKKGKKPLEPDISSWSARLENLKNQPGVTHKRLKVRPFIEEGVRVEMDREGQLSLAVCGHTFAEVGADLLASRRLSAVCNKLLLTIARHAGFSGAMLVDRIASDEGLEDDFE